MLRVEIERTMICLLLNILKVKLKSRFPKLTLGWCHFFNSMLFSLATLLILKKRNNLCGPLSSSRLNTHLDCFDPNRCKKKKKKIRSSILIHSESRCSGRCNDSLLLACWEGMTMSKGSILVLVEYNRCDEAAECQSFWNCCQQYFVSPLNLIFFELIKFILMFLYLFLFLRIYRCAKKEKNTWVWRPSLWSTCWVSTETLVNGCSSALCERNQPVITEKTRQVWAAWEMKCTNYCLSVLEQRTQELKQLEESSLEAWELP